MPLHHGGISSALPPQKLPSAYFNTSNIGMPTVTTVKTNWISFYMQIFQLFRYTIKLFIVIYAGHAHSSDPLDRVAVASVNHSVPAIQFFKGTVITDLPLFSKLKSL